MTVDWTIFELRGLLGRFESSPCVSHALQKTIRFLEKPNKKTNLNNEKYDVFLPKTKSAIYPAGAAGTFNAIDDAVPASAGVSDILMTAKGLFRAQTLTAGSVSTELESLSETQKRKPTSRIAETRFKDLIPKSR
uniref:Uncharacterized protein n=1 Tax=Romanomermis culicivorax TaxID=13658 RepID=A0A915IK58_ROMCU